jgi:CHAT domain-containing protein
LFALARVDRNGAADRWDYLPGSERELRLLQARNGQGAVRVLEGSAASSARLLEELPRARLAHLATHGFFNERAFRAERGRREEQLRTWQFQTDRTTGLAGGGAKNPLAYTGLVLAGANVPDQAGADGGILTGEVLLDLPLERLQLAVLSACQTGLGDVLDGECVQNLQRAFHLAGCRNVVASLWNVPDEATAALMAVFYDELLHKGRLPLEALRAAQLHVYRHPEQVRELAERGPPQTGVVAKAPAATPRPGGGAQRQTAVKDWAGFVLSGLGR